MKPKAVAFDLDGTLAESKQVMAPAMASLLLRLMQPPQKPSSPQRGEFSAKNSPTSGADAPAYVSSNLVSAVAVLSGAGWPQFQSQFLSAFPAGADFSNLYLFPDNAAQCFTYKDGVWQERYNLVFSPAEAAEIKAALAEALAESNFTPPLQLWGEQIENRGAQISFSALGQQAPLEIKKEWRAAHDIERTNIRGILSKKLPNYSVVTGGETTIDITRTGVTKSYGLQKLSEFTQISISDMVYVGDALQEGGNDSVVIETGVQTQAVSGPEDTAAFIQQLI